MYIICIDVVQDCSDCDDVHVHVYLISSLFMQCKKKVNGFGKNFLKCQGQ